MKIGIDARNYFNKDKSGVDYYVKSLVENLSKYDKNNQYYFFFDSRLKKSILPSKTSNVRYIKIPFKKKYAPAVDLAAKLLNLDIVHYTTGGPSIPNLVPYLATIYDLTFEIHPEFYNDEDLLKQKKTKKIAQRSTGIISISNSTKKDLVEKYNIKPSKITVTHLAFNKKSFKNNKFKTKDYFLFVGNLQPRKNLMKILQAISDLDVKERPKLIVAGNIQDRDEMAKAQKFIRKNKLDKKIFFRGYVSEKELDKLYRECIGVIYPSVYEGFGYNILEAFYYQKPLITSNASSMPEIAKDAAVYVNPQSSISIKNAIEKVAKDKNNNSRIIKKGIAILKNYTIEKMINETLRAYEKFFTK